MHQSERKIVHVREREREIESEGVLGLPSPSPNDSFVFTLLLRHGYVNIQQFRRLRQASRLRGFDKQRTDA